MPYSSKIQQRLRAKLPPEPLERLERLGVGDLGVDVHRHVDLRMAQDPHGNPRMHVERGQESGTGMACFCKSRVRWDSCCDWAALISAASATRILVRVW